jgi:hypothetical protein
MKMSFRTITRARIPALSMTTKAKPARSPAPVATTRVLKLQAQKGEDHPTALARNMIRPEVGQPIRLTLLPPQIATIIRCR